MAKRTQDYRAELRGNGTSTSPVHKPVRWLSSGSTVLNMACTGKPDGAFPSGSYVLFIGDSDSGKTFICLTCFAEAANNPEFDDYQLIYDAPEGGALMDIAKFFGSKTAARLRAPAYDADGLPVHSRTAESFYYHLDEVLKKGPAIYILDSQDSLSSEAEEKKFGKDKRIFQRGEKKGPPAVGEENGETKTGSFGDGKAKVHSQKLRAAVQNLQKTQSILIIINQSRDSFDMFNPSTFSGGRALKFYATFQLWSSQGGVLKKVVRGKERELGILAKVRIKKNRAVGRKRAVVIPIYHTAGLDEVGSCVDYLVAERVWKKPEGSAKITVTGLGPELVLDRESLVEHIENHNLEDELRELVTSTWMEIEAACVVDRKSRYE